MLADKISYLQSKIQYQLFPCLDKYLDDSQAGIPLSIKSSARVQIMYELMDTAYDVNAIREYISGQERVPLIKFIREKEKERGCRNE